MDKTIYEFKKESAKRKAKAVLSDAKKKADEAVRWGMDHPAEAIALAGLLVGGVKKASSAYQTHAEDRRRDIDFYDPRTGRHSKARRKLKPYEQVRVTERYNRGESYDKILYEMGLLK